VCSGAGVLVINRVGQNRICTPCMTVYFMVSPGGCKYHDFLNSGVDPIKNYIFEILTMRPIDWYIIESILRGLEWGGGV